MTSPLRLKHGDRIRLIRMQRDPDPVPPGTCGTVDNVVNWHGQGYIVQMVSWDNGRTLNLSVPPDEFEMAITYECDRVDCHEPGVWIPILVMKPYEDCLKCAQATLPLHVCDAHKLEATVEEFTNAKGWETICESFAKAGLREPKRELTTLQWVKL
jgi:hypothetical protein